VVRTRTDEKVPRSSAGRRPQQARAPQQMPPPHWAGYGGDDDSSAWSDADDED
jgi:hypothetical protein